MGVFKRTRTNKDGKKTDFWYMRYSLNGKMKWEQVTGSTLDKIKQAESE